MKIFFLLILISSILKLNAAFSQNLKLVGLVENNLVQIDENTGKASAYKEIKGLPAGENIFGLTYHFSNSLFYGLKNISNNPSLVSISGEGEYEEIGPLTIGGKQISLAEAIAYNPESNKLYLGVSLNGGVKDNDYYSESIVEVDPLTGECNFIMELFNQELDAFTFRQNVIYFFDGTPPSVNYLGFYSLNFSDPSFPSRPDLIYESTYLPIRDFALLEETIYFVENKRLHKFSISNGRTELVGTTHQNFEFNGKNIQGISKMEICDTPVVELGNDFTLCNANSFLLDASFPGATYTWQDGSTEPSFLVTKSGTYWVRVENSCGFERDTIEVLINSEPDIDLGKDRLICDANSLLLDVSFPGATYTWQDGSTEPSFLVTQSGTYWVKVENSCGVRKDSVELILVDESSLKVPNVFTPNSDGLNDYFEIDERLIGSSLQVYNRHGKLVYESNYYKNNWDGGDLFAGTYFYMIRSSCGRVNEGWLTIIKGIKPIK